MKDYILKDSRYQKTMEQTVIPYLEQRKTELWPERESGKKIHCLRYLADHARGTVLISHGFTETAEKFMECTYYFLKERYHVYCIDHCGHGMSYRMTEDLSLVHVDRYERYVEDLLFVADLAQKEQGHLPLFLYGHSMGGGISAAAAAREPYRFRKVILTSPMIRPQTGPVPWYLARLIAETCCAFGRGGSYVIGYGPYDGKETFEQSVATSRARFEYYHEKRDREPYYQMNSPSYSWLRGAGRLNAYLRKDGWKQIQASMLLFQAEKETLVSQREQERFIRKLKSRGEARLVRIPDSKHEIYNSEEQVVRGYWKKIFRYLGE